MIRRLSLLFTLLLIAMPQCVADEKPFLHQLFTDHMVLQRGVEIPIWGWADPGQEVKVSLNGKTAKATSAADGKWMAKLGVFSAGGPFELMVTGSQSVTVKDVLIGDVWVCSGQSNMEWPVAASNNSAAEIASASHPEIRLFTVPKRVSGEPQETVNSAWQVCSPQTVPGFSAVGYFFGRELQQRLDVPVGLINTSWGGTIAEAWTSADALKTMDDFRPAVETFQKSVAAQKLNAESLISRWMPGGRLPIRGRKAGGKMQNSAQPIGSR